MLRRLLLCLLLVATPALLPAETDDADTGPAHQASAASMDEAIVDGDLARVRALLTAGEVVHHHHLPPALLSGRLPLIRQIADALPERHRLAPDLLATYLAAGGADSAVVEWLLLDGAVIEGRNNDGDTALMAAARREQHALVTLLLRYGADPQAVSASGCDLSCFYRPAASATSQWPEMDQRPAAFMVLALAPALLLYFALAAWRLHRRRPLGALTLGLIIALGLSIALSATLFYRCDPCLVAPGPQQLLISAATSLLFSLVILAPLLRRRFTRTF